MALAKDAPYSDITYKIIGAAMEVHNKLGPSHKEIVCQKALSAKMLEASLSFEEEKSIESVIPLNVRWPIDLSPTKIRHLKLEREESSFVNPFNIC